VLLPMKAVSGPLPEGDGWAYEIKWDGMRALIDVGDDFRITSANGRDATASYPDLALGASSVPVAATLDGEIIALDDAGKPSFGTLQQRMHVANVADAARRAEIVPVQYLVFDIVRLDGRDVTGLTYEERRRLLEQLFDGWDGDPRWRLVTVFDDGPTLLEAVSEQKLEGVVAKRLDSRYEPGKRSRAWVKVKVRCEQELVIGGWLPGEGGREGRIGALMVGYHDPTDDGDGGGDEGGGDDSDSGPLRYAGRVGTGFSDTELRRLEALFAPLASDECPFDPVPTRADAPNPHWLDPVLVCQVAFTEWTSDGRLRHPVYLGTRDDKDANDVTKE
jgi:bifunctional non-homologous end joining protein LigD